jgi:hypothetical protein
MTQIPVRGLQVQIERDGAATPADAIQLIAVLQLDLQCHSNCRRVAAAARIYIRTKRSPMSIRLNVRA